MNPDLIEVGVIYNEKTDRIGLAFMEGDCPKDTRVIIYDPEDATSGTYIYNIGQLIYRGWHLLGDFE